MLELIVVSNIFYLTFELISYSIAKASRLHLRSIYSLDLFILLTIVSSYAIFKTAGKTILILNLVLILYFLIRNFRQASENLPLKNSGLYPKRIWYGLLTFNFLFFVHYFHIIEFGSDSFRHINEDYYFYSRLSGYLRDFGVENINVEYFLEEKGGLTPYHYFELWFAAFVSDLTNLHSLKALKLTVFPLIQTLCVLGFFELLKSELKQFRLKSQALYIFAILVLFCSGLNFLYPNSIEFIHQDLYGISILEISKLSIVLFLIIGFYKGILSNDLTAISIYSSFIAINYITCVPSLVLFSVFWCIFKIRRSQKVRAALLANLPFILTCLLIVLFYSAFGEKKIHGTDMSKIPDILSGDYLTIFFNIIVKISIQIVICCIPFLAIIFVLIKRKHVQYKYKEVFLSHFVLVFGGLVSWAFLHNTLTSTQLWNNIYIVSNIVLVIFSVILLISYVSRNNKLSSVIITSSVILFAIYSMQRFYNPTKSIEKFNASDLNLSENSSFVFCRKKEAYINYGNQLEQIFFGRNTSLFHELDPLRITCISPDKIVPKDSLHSNIKSNLTLVKFFEGLKAKNSKIQFEGAQLKFIKTFNIEYLLLEKDALISEEISNLFETESCAELNNYHVFKRKK